MIYGVRFVVLTETNAIYVPLFKSSALYVSIDKYDIYYTRARRGVGKNLVKKIILIKNLKMKNALYLEIKFTF